MYACIDSRVQVAAAAAAMQHRAGQAAKQCALCSCPTPTAPTACGASDLAVQVLGFALLQILLRHHGLQEAVAVGGAEVAAAAVAFRCRRRCRRGCCAG